MWLYSVYGFYSVVCATDQGVDMLMVRSRKQSHLVNLQKRFPELLASYKILRWKNRDYACRIIVPRSIFGQVLVELTEEATWTNFKDEVTKRQGHSQYVSILHRVWGIMFNYQADRATHIIDED